MPLARRLLLPARLDDAGDLAFEGALPEAQTAKFKFTKERTRATAHLATIVLA